MIITPELDYIIKQQKDKRVIKRILKIYEALVYKKGKSSNWFSVPSLYLKKVNGQYNKVIPILKEYGIIEYKSINSEYKYDDLFSSNLYHKKLYYPNQSMRYRFLIDIDNGYKYNLDTDFNSLYDNEKWFIKTKYSLLQLEFPLDGLVIKRDNFSRRLHTNITGCIPGERSYKELLKNKNYCIIDSKTSQPRLLWLTLKESGLSDKNLDYIFENDLDFYDYIIERIPDLIDREDAKELFTSWVNGTGYLNPEKSSIRDIFQVAHFFIKNFKSQGYKDVCRLLQYKESKIFIDDLLNDCPTKFCLSVHDSLIVKKEDAKLVYEYCVNKYPYLVFTLEEIK